MIGKIKLLKKENGYGFIISENNQKDIFFHVSQLQKTQRFEDLEEGQIVSFEIGNSPRGQQAFDVCLISNVDVTVS